MFELWQDSFDGLPLKELKVDQAFLNVTSTLQNNVWLYSLSDECVSVSISTKCADFLVIYFVFRNQCPYKRVQKVPANGNLVDKIPTSSALSYLVLDSNHGRYAYGNE